MMMDDIKTLVEMVANLPSMALWVIAAFWAYKVIFIGSVYGVIRLAVNRFYEFKVKPPCVPPPQEIQMKLGIKCLDEITYHAINAQIARLYSNGGYIHNDVVTKLRKAIDIVEGE